VARSPKEKPRAFARGLLGWRRGDFQRLAAGRILELKVENPKSNCAGARKAQGDVTREFREEGLDFLFLFCSSEASLLVATVLLEVFMTVEKQREVIRLWNQLRKLEGPAAEELRIQILECFSERDVSEKNLSAKNTVKRAA
jgi:hypothetical protein